MKILHISDTHGLHDHFPMDRFDGIDVVVHSGDCSNHYDPKRNQKEVISFVEWYQTVPVKHKVFVAGNHDTCLDIPSKKYIGVSDFTSVGITYLENEAVTIDGVNFWGSPHTPTFGTWAFMKSRQKIHEVWEKIPTNTEVLIVHGPPWGIRDLTYNRNNELEMCGDKSLMKWIFFNGVDIKAVLFGHIHNHLDIDNQGTSVYSRRPNIVFSNASCVEDARLDKGLISFGNIIEISKPIKQKSII